MAGWLVVPKLLWALICVSLTFCQGHVCLFWGRQQYTSPSKNFAGQSWDVMVIIFSTWWIRRCFALGSNEDQSGHGQGFTSLPVCSHPLRASSALKVRRIDPLKGTFDIAMRRGPCLANRFAPVHFSTVEANIFWIPQRTVAHPKLTPKVVPPTKHSICKKAPPMAMLNSVRRYSCVFVTEYYSRVKSEQNTPIIEGNFAEWCTVLADCTYLDIAHLPWAKAGFCPGCSQALRFLQNGDKRDRKEINVATPLNT